MSLTNDDLSKVLKDILKVDISKSKTLKTAFVHRSYLNEHHDFDLPSNERLEFLGDAVLQLLTSNYLYSNYDHDEGLLTNFRSSLVNTQALAQTARELSLGKLLYLSRGEERNGGREREYILANTFEAFLGALFLEQGIDSCRELLERVLFPKLEGIIENKSYKDYKSSFQEKAQEKYLVTPIYELVDEVGPDHEKEFTVCVKVGDKILGEGKGKSKQRAEQAAAKGALNNL